MCIHSIFPIPITSSRSEQQGGSQPHMSLWSCRVIKYQSISHDNICYHLTNFFFLFFQSLVVSDSDGKKTSKLAGSSSITSIVSQTSTEKSTKTSGGRAASWALSFDKLLADRAGLAAFTVSAAHISVMSHEHHGVSNHQQLKCLLNSLFRLTTKLCTSGPLICARNSLVIRGVP